MLKICYQKLAQVSCIKNLTKVHSDTFKTQPTNQTAQLCLDQKLARSCIKFLTQETAVQVSGSTFLRVCHSPPIRINHNKITKHHGQMIETNNTK